MASYVQDDLSYLNNLPQSLNQTRIAGEVTRYDKDDENPQGTTRRLAAVRLTIKGEGKEYEVVTDANGVYQLYGAPAGKYIIQLHMPAGLTLFGVIHYGPLDTTKLHSFNIELRESACSGADILLTPDPAFGKPKIGN